VHISVWLIKNIIPVSITGANRFTLIIIAASENIYFVLTKAEITA